MSGNDPKRTSRDLRSWTEVHLVFGNNRGKSVFDLLAALSGNAAR
jgi:hypothetical protein